MEGSGLPVLPHLPTHLYTTMPSSTTFRKRTNGHGGTKPESHVIAIRSVHQAVHFLSTKVVYMENKYEVCAVLPSIYRASRVNLARSSRIG